jgi:hypothetical protein
VAAKSSAELDRVWEHCTKATQPAEPRTRRSVPDGRLAFFPRRQEDVEASRADLDQHVRRKRSHRCPCSNGAPASCPSICRVASAPAAAPFLLRLLVGGCASDGQLPVLCSPSGTRTPRNGRHGLHAKERKQGVRQTWSHLYPWSAGGSIAAVSRTRLRRLCCTVQCSARSWAGVAAAAAPASLNSHSTRQRAG